jgi:hypothetical protein
MGSESGGPLGSAGEAAVLRTQRVHRSILSLLQDLGRADDLSTILGLLGDLCGVLPDHFADEEGADGLFEALRLARPEVHPRRKFLQEEHRKMIQALEALREQAAGGHWELARVKRELAALLRQVRRHERAESVLIADVYYLDEGGSG